MIVFSYGSNMSTKRLEERVGKVELIGTGQLYHHQLRLHKESTDRSAKADAFYTGQEHDYLWGVLHHLKAGQKAQLDKFENLGFSYFEKKAEVQTMEDEKYEAIFYVAANQFINPKIKPYEWYMNFIVKGALEHQLPAKYINLLQSIPFTTDPDQERRIIQFKIAV